MTPEPARTLRPAGASVAFETQVDAGIGATEGPCADAFEPIVVAHPTDPALLAVAYQRYGSAGNDECFLDPAVAISHDGGRTWTVTPRDPWSGSGRWPDHHAVVAWGPGPTPGSARLYWADATSGSSDGARASVAWSDDEGDTWSPLYVEWRTPAWVGGYPDITVDRNPASPGYGRVYVTYNWLESARLGPGLHVLASADFGETWEATEIPKVPGPSGFDAAWRIGYRVRTAPDGAAYVSFYQADLRSWDSSNIFAKGGGANVGRLGIAVARVVLDPRTGELAARPATLATTFPKNVYTVNAAFPPGAPGIYVDPEWSTSLDVDAESGRILLAAAEFRPDSTVDEPRGTIRVGHSDDGGQTWEWTAVPPPEPHDGCVQSGFSPSIVAAGGGAAVVGFHSLTDLVGSRPTCTATVGAAFAVSFDGGSTFGAPSPISDARWRADALATAQTGPGLRARADRAADGNVIVVYGDGRLAGTSGGMARSAVFAALVTISRPITAVVPEVPGGRIVSR